MTPTCPNCHHPLHREAHFPIEQLYVMESRHPDGKLNLRNPEPPFLICTIEQISDFYYTQIPGEKPESWETIRAWYAQQGWTWRKKTW